MGIVKNWLKSGLSSVKPLLSFDFMIGIPFLSVLRPSLSSGETHDLVHGSFITFMKLSKKGDSFFGISIKPCHALMLFL